MLRSEEFPYVVIRKRDNRRDVVLAHCQFKTHAIILARAVGAAAERSEGDEISNIVVYHRGRAVLASHTPIDPPTIDGNISEMLLIGSAHE